MADANPGNNFGDYNPTNLCDWTFCFSIRTVPPAQCVQGQSLHIAIDTYGDGETGSWTSLACTGDAITEFFATLACCQPPIIVPAQPLCNGQNGSATGSGQGIGPWDYIWKNNAGTIIQQTNNVNGNNAIAILAPGSYSLVTVDNNGCSSTDTIVVSPDQIKEAHSDQEARHIFQLIRIAFQIARKQQQKRQHEMQKAARQPLLPRRVL